MRLEIPLDTRRHAGRRAGHPIVWLWLCALALGIAIVAFGCYALIWFLTHSD